MIQQLRNEQILLVGLPAWEGNYLKSTVLLATELAKENEVLYVEYPFTWKDVYMGRLSKSQAPWKRILGKEKRLRKISLENGKNINVLTLPPMWPANFLNSEPLYDSLMLANAKKACKAIQQAMYEIGMDRPVVINAFNPFLGVFLSRQFNERALLYYCYDEISAAKWASKHGPRLEQHLMREADAVIVSSQPLFEVKKHHANQIYLVKNGVDFSLFNSETKKFGQQDKKVIGYLGSMDERLDYDLLEATVKQLPQYRFCFVGRINSSRAVRLRKYKNVEIVGSQPPASLPTWVQTFDVCMIPFAKNKFTAGIYPIKINEYFAAGKPVVSTLFSDLSDFQHLIGTAISKEMFIKQIEKMLREDDPLQAQKRTTFARQNSWTCRAAELGKAIQCVTEGINQKKADGDWTRMPNNYNRWGAVSASFFQSKPVHNLEQGSLESHHDLQPVLLF